jgi:tetratricopeptide (TPR) repeat protein
MAVIHVACPRCATGYKVEEVHRGKKAKCKKCGAKFGIGDAPTGPPVAAKERPRGEDGIPIDWEPGDVIFGVYEVIRFPGTKDGYAEGGMGRVNLVRHRQWQRAVLARQPHFAPALGECGRLALAQAEPARAEALLREALTQDAANVQLRYQLIQCLFQGGRVDEAEAERRRLEKLKADLNRLEKITTTEMPQRPHDPALHHELARLLLDVGRPEEAVQWLQRALREDPSYQPAHRTLALYYQRAGNREGVADQSRSLPAPQPARPTPKP